MNQYTLSLLACVGGVFLAAQGGLNAHLGVLLKHPLLASVVAFLSSSIFAIVMVLCSVRTFPTVHQLKDVPVYLWCTGGFFSVVGISLYYYTIPKLGVSTMISFGLCGQLLFAVVAGHFGWLNLPVEPMTLQRIAGVLAMIGGIFLINWT
ncbi:DMT family transporter [Reichenbachiella agariperforans]|uniref:Transporter family-2 protein n=1 Tax=Reichenbachiella agariperforans TaxID=156994 RepID=A0A1M6KJ10_REIAG|nr:DMT family transporter [Reichenbachiella agariperforans]MBU2913578.1 DMT family transporter [Reichenbachiella agariperforans]SHJ58978.1 transporter family-2 protein [Reichenbachiella agariperforans]